jgi:hypothetical protein
MRSTPSVASDFVVAATLASNRGQLSGKPEKTRSGDEATESPFSMPAFGIALNEAGKVREGEPSATRRSAAPRARR